MKKTAILFVSGAMLSLAACQPDNSGANNQEQIDSMVNARVEEIRMQLMMQNDSMINAMAQMRADSIIAGMKGGNAVVTKKVTTTTTRVNTPPPVTPAPPVQTTQDTKFDTRANGTNEISTDKKKEQDNKFNKRGG